jgi:hypothetical protein
MKKANSKPLTSGQKQELAALARLPDDRIDTSSFPEVGSETRRLLPYPEAATYVQAGRCCATIKVRIERHSG